MIQVQTEKILILLMFLSINRGEECDLTVGGPKPKVPCVFPFTFNNHAYTKCTHWRENWGHPEWKGKSWCSTKVDSNGYHIAKQNQYGLCSDKCEVEFIHNVTLVAVNLYECLNDTECSMLKGHKCVENRCVPDTALKDTHKNPAFKSLSMGKMDSPINKTTIINETLIAVHSYDCKNDEECKNLKDHTCNVEKNFCVPRQEDTCKNLDPCGCTATGPNKGVPCVFPFTHLNVTYQTCALWIDTWKGKKEGETWCSTKTDENGIHIRKQKQYGFCKDECKANTTDSSNQKKTKVKKKSPNFRGESLGIGEPSPSSPSPPATTQDPCKDLGPCDCTATGPNKGVPCIFPFTHMNVTYKTCAPWKDKWKGKKEGKTWCSTKTNENGIHIRRQKKYGFCKDECDSNASKSASSSSFRGKRLGIGGKIQSATTQGEETPSTTTQDPCNDLGPCECTVAGPKKRAPCIFPFIHENITASSCMKWESNWKNVKKKGDSWCSTKTDENGIHAQGEGEFGFCNDRCLKNSQGSEGGTDGRDTLTIKDVTTGEIKHVPRTNFPGENSLGKSHIDQLTSNDYESVAKMPP